MDMDCFYAAIECRDDPSVADKPVGVGGSSGRGVLTTCNYIARQYGCRSAMPVFQARQLCPEIILKPVRFDVYREESRKIRRILREYSDLVEPLSLDEAYIDVSHRDEYAWDLARTIRRRIFETTQLTASAGVAPNKMLAKIASDWRKPNGQFAVLPSDVGAFMKALPVRKIWGIGPKSTERLKELGIETCGQLQKWPRHKLYEHFGEKWGNALYDRCRGRDDRPVEPHHVRKSLSNERTFTHDLHTIEACRERLPALISELESDLRKHPDRAFRKIFLKLKFANFRTTTCESPSETVDRDRFHALLEEAFGRSPHAVRLMGVGVRFTEAEEADPRQLELGLSDS